MYRISKQRMAVLSGGAVDTTRPTCTISSTSSVITAGNPTVTFTFSESVTGFEIGDITVGNGAASSFSGSGASYSCTITPTAAGTVTVDVAEGVCADAAGNTNTAATQWTILSTKGSTLWRDVADISTLFQNTGRTTAVTTDDQNVLGITDKSGANNHLTQAAGGKYKVNIQNGLSGILMNGSSNFYEAAASWIGATTSYTALIVKRATSGQILLHGKGGTSVGRVYIASATSGFYYNNSVNITGSGISMTGTNLIIVKYDAATQTGYFRFNGSATWYSLSPTTSYDTSMTALDCLRTDSGYHAGYVNEDLYFPSLLSDATINLFRTYLNTKWAVF